MRGNKKVITLIIAIAIIVMLSILLYFVLKDNDDDTEYKDISIKDKYSSVLRACGEELTFDNYTVVLDRSYYNKSTGDVCCVLNIRNNSGEKITHQVSCDEQLGTVNIHHKGSEYTETLMAMVSGSGNVELEYEYIDGIVNVYIFAAMLPENKNIEISFVEEHKKISGADVTEWQKFVLKETSDSITFQVDNMPVSASETAIVFDANLGIKELDIVYNDDDKVSIVKAGNLAEGYERISNEEIQKYVYAELKDTKEIKCLKVNGESYYPEQTEAQQPYADSEYIFNESDGMKQSIETKANKEANTVDVTITASWTPSPKMKSTDMIWLKWYDMYYIEGSKCKVTHKVGDKEIECQQIDENKDLYGTLSAPISAPIEVESDTYDIDTEGIYIFTSLNKDKNSSGYEEAVVVELQLDLSKYKIVNPKISTNCYHIRDLEKGTNIIESLSNIDRVGRGLIFKLATEYDLEK